MKKNRIILILAAMLLPLAAGAQCNVELPFSEDFESCTTGGNSKPACWTRVDSIASGSAVYPNVFQRSDAHSKVVSFSSQCATCQNDYIYLATPRIPAPLNELEISFEILRGSLSVFLTTDLDDRDSYVLIGSYTNASYTDWGTPIEIRTDEATILFDTGYVVFGKAVTSSYDVTYLDNVSIIQLNPCPRPDWVHVDAVTTSSAALSWPAVDGTQGYRITYSTSEDMQEAETVTTTATSLLLNDLEVGEDYYVWVQTVCGTDNYSDPRTTTFTTQLPCYPIVNLRLVNVNSFAASFAWEYDMRGYEAEEVYVTVHDLTDPTNDDIEEVSVGSTYHFMLGLDPTHVYEATFRTICGADSADGVSQTIVFRGCGESPLSNGGYARSGYCPIAAGYNTGSSAMLYDYQIVADMDTIGGIALHRYVGDNTVNVTRTLNIFMGNTTLDSLTSNPSTSGLQQVASGVQYTLAAQEWDTLLFTTPFVYDGTSNVLVVISDITGTAGTGNPTEWYWHNADTKTYHTTVNSYGSLTNSDYNRPDMRFIGECQDNNTCDAPIAVAESVDSTSVTLAWTAGTAMGWVIEYRTEGAANWVVADTIMDESYTITGLTPSLHYEARIGAVCETPTRYSGVVPFTTLCSPLHLPFHFTATDMAAAVTSGFSPCYAHSTYFYRTRLTLSHRATVFNAGNGEWFMLPPIIEPLAGARLRTWAASSSACIVLVGVASEDDASDVVWVDTISIEAGNPNTSTDEYIAYLDSYTGDGNRVVLSPVVDNNYHYCYFFDFHIEPIEGCRPPARLTLDSTDASSLSLSWTPVGSAGMWIVYRDGTQVGTTSVPHYTVSGLNPYTDYEITVRSSCDGDETSLPVSGTFRTGCTGESCVFTVSCHSATANGWNGGILVISSGDTIVGSFKMTNGHNTERSYMVCDGMPLEFTWLSGNADEVCSFEVINPYGDTVYQVASASGLDTLPPFMIDSICSVVGGDEPGPGPGPGPNPEGIDEANGLASLLVAPNPASSQVTLSGIRERATVAIMDLNGREVYRQENVLGNVTVNTASYAKGVYFVRVVSERASVTRKLIVN